MNEQVPSFGVGDHDQLSSEQQAGVMLTCGSLFGYVVMYKRYCGKVYRHVHDCVLEVVPTYVCHERIFTKMLTLCQLQLLWVRRSHVDIINIHVADTNCCT